LPQFRNTLDKCDKQEIQSLHEASLVPFLNLAALRRLTVLDLQLSKMLKLRDDIHILGVNICGPVWKIP